MKTDWKANRWKILLLFAACLVAYLPAIGGGFIWDDDDYVTENLTLRSAGGLGRIWLEPGANYQYYPLVHTVFWIEYHLWGLNPLGYHVLNVLLHAANAVLVALLLRRLNVPAPWLAAAIFALHPIQVESVAWVTELKNVLSGLFYLGSALLYLKGGRRNRAISLGLFICALLSKSVACTLPGALLAVAWWKHGKLDWKRDVVPLAPFFGLGAISAAATAWLEAHTVGALGSAWTFSLAERCLIAGRAFWFYLIKLIWPVDLCFVYPRWTLETGAFWQWLAPAAALGLFAAFWVLRARLGRAPLAAALIFGVTLSPALGFVSFYPMIYSFVADHFVYLAAIAPIAVFAAVVSRVELARRGAPLVLFALAGLTWNQAGNYVDLKTLWTDTLEKNPGAWMAHANLGNVLFLEGKVGEATAHFAEALRLKPDDDSIHYNLGAVLDAQGRKEEAAAQYREAIRLNPRSAQAYHNLGKVLADQGDFEGALSHFRKALEIKPDYAKAMNNIGILYARQGNLDQAIAEYSDAVRYDPDFFDPYNNLGVALARQRRMAEAVRSFERAVELRPESAEARNNLGYALVQEGRLEEARSQYEAALRIKPDLANAREGLARIEQSLGSAARPPSP